MCPNVEGGVNMTPAVVWRIMPKRPVLTIDEVDTIFGFEKEDDALEWIKEKSQAWLLEQR